MVVVSLFDGPSIAQVALKRFRIPYDEYFASEIDPVAIAITQKHHKKTRQLGNVLDLKGRKIPNGDFLVGGSPCQGLSFAGKKLYFKDPRSKLFYQFIRIRDKMKPKSFFFENVRMRKKEQDIISSYFGVEPVMINSNLVSAQNRNRLYWTNLPIPKIRDKKIFWSDIMEHDAQDVMYFSKKTFKWVIKDEKRRGKFTIYKKDSKVKMQMIEASHHKTVSNQRCFGIVDVNGIRYISPLECERAQTWPDNYTEGLKRTPRYVLIGNGFTTDIVGQFFKGLK